MTKELWFALETKYDLNNARIDMYNVSSFRKFRIEDGKPMNPQLHSFQECLRKAQSIGTIFSEDFKVTCLVDALPPY